MTGWIIAGVLVIAIVIIGIIFVKTMWDMTFRG